MASSCFVIALLFFQSSRSQDVPENFPLDVGVSMSGEFDKVENDKYIFAIDVTPKTGKPWRVMHRFNDFHSLLSELGVESDVMPDAPFASRVQGSEEYGKFIADRRKTLEVWLQRVVKEAKDAKEGAKLKWKVPVQKFLHPSAKPGTYLKEQVYGKISGWWGSFVDQFKDPNAEPVVEPIKEPEPELDVTRLDVQIAMTGESDVAEKTRHIYSIDVKHSSGETWQVMHRYNDFYTLSNQLGSLAKTIAGASFPGALQGMTPYDQFISERRTGLETWLNAVLKHREARVSWAKALLEFLDVGAAPGAYSNDFFQQWMADLKDGLDSAKEQTKAASASASASASELFASASAAAESAKARFTEFADAQTKYAAALFEKKQAEESGSDEAIQGAAKKVEEAKSAMLEAGAEVKHSMQEAETLKEDMQDAALSGTSNEEL